MRWRPIESGLEAMVLYGVQNVIALLYIGHSTSGVVHRALAIGGSFTLCLVAGLDSEALIHTNNYIFSSSQPAEKP